MDEDRRTGKRTLAVRFGPGFARGEYIAAVVTACLLPFLLYLASGQRTFTRSRPSPSSSWRCPHSGVCSLSEGPLLNPVLAYTARLLLLYSAVFSVGWVL